MDFYDKPPLQNKWHYVTDSSDFIEQMKIICKFQKYSTVTADVINFYPRVS